MERHDDATSVKLYLESIGTLRDDAAVLAAACASLAQRLAVETGTPAAVLLTSALTG